jgi:hypothetical protein
MQVSNGIQEIILKNAGLNNKKALTLIHNLRKEKIKTIDLSYNPLLNGDFYQEFSKTYLRDYR